MGASVSTLHRMRPADWGIADCFANEESGEPVAKGSFQPVKLQRPDRATVCSHSLWDMTTKFPQLTFIVRSQHEEAQSVKTTRPAGDTADAQALVLCRRHSAALTPWQKSPHNVERECAASRYRWPLYLGNLFEPFS